LSKQFLGEPNEGSAVNEDGRLRLVDSHVHLWDLGANPWYPAMQDSEAAKAFASLGDATRMARDFLIPELGEETVAVDLLGIVHVSAASAPRVHVDESRWLEGVLDELGLPAVTVGALEATQSRREMEADLDDQASPRLRGARVLTGLAPESAAAADVCAALGERRLVFDLVAHPKDMAGFRALLERFPGLTVVLEHAGWPEAVDSAGRASWREAIGGLAELPNVSCKVAGLGMATHSLAAEVLRPWIEGCLEAFGPERCIFGGNFPVEAMYGGYDELIAAMRAVTDQLAEGERRAFFVDNARRAYGL
jgi:predicted TIM-barrel fold metal-dependent hydrolase